MRVCLLVLCFITAPAAAGDKALERIAFGSCVHQEDKQPIWDAVNALKPDLFLLAGDNIYHDVHRSAEAKKWTIDKKYEVQAAVPGFKTLRDSCPVIGTWDDHDYGLNDAGAEYPHKKETQRAFLDFFGVPKDSPRRTQEGVYHAQVFGPPEKSVQVILLDTRYFRSKLLKKAKTVSGVGPYLPNPDGMGTMLGEAQWKWLEEQLKVPAKIRLLVSSIQVVPEDHGWEKWMNLPHERDRLYKLLRDAKAAAVIVLSGDRHLAELSMMDAGIGYPLYDLTSSGLSMGFDYWRPQEVNRHRVATMNHGNNFGSITIDWEAKEPLIRLQIRDEAGEVTIQQKVLLKDLQPGRIKSKEVSAAAGPKLNGKLLTADLLKEWMGKEVMLDMTVKATGGTKKGDLVFLNSTEDRGPDNFTVVLDKKAMEMLKATPEALQKTYLGRRIHVTGTLSTFRDQPQIIVSDGKQIRLEE